jgi:hypothetical protein
MANELLRVKDNAGGDLILYYRESIANTPVVAIFLKIYAEIIEKGWSNPTMPFGNRNRVVWVERPGGAVVGGICFEYNALINTGWIVLSFTDPVERGKGINGICHASVERILKKLGATKISSLVHVDNESRLRSAKKVGMVPQFYRMSKNI